MLFKDYTTSFLQYYDYHPLQFKKLSCSDEALMWLRYCYYFHLVLQHLALHVLCRLVVRLQAAKCSYVHYTPCTHLIGKCIHPLQWTTTEYCFAQLAGTLTTNLQSNLHLCILAKTFSYVTGEPLPSDNKRLKPSCSALCLNRSDGIV